MQLFAIEAPSRRSVLLSPIFLLLAAHAAAQGANTLPSGGVVGRGQATLNVQGNVLTVTNSPGTIINWQSFSIGSGATTNFVQPSASSAVLNRVVGQNVSAISGRLLSNGHVFLTNPNGVLINSGAQINAASFTAMTSAISDADFVAGNTQWSGEGSFLSTNALLTVDGGALSLSPSGITSPGTVTVADLGNLSLLTAGSQVLGNLAMNGGLLTIQANSVEVGGAPLGRPIAARGPIATISESSLLTVTLDVSTGGAANLASANVVVNNGNLSLTSGNGRTGAFRNRLRSVSGASVGATQLTTNGAQVVTTGGTLALMTDGAITTSRTAASGATITLQKREPQF
jgi:filamentous hemagglutinin family protein